MTKHFSLPSSKWLISLSAITGLLLIILYALGFIGGGEKIKPGTHEAALPLLPANAETFTLTREVANNVLAWQGTVRSRQAVKITPKLNARIIEVTVHPGDSVKQGAVLARLDNRDLTAAYQAAQAAQAAAQAQAMEARADAKRFSELYQKQAATRQQYDAVMAKTQTADAMVKQAAESAKQAHVMLTENVLYAPFAGVVGERLQEPGDMGMANQPLLTLLKPDDLRLETAITATCAHTLRLGETVSVRIDGIAQQLTGQIDEIAPETNPETRSQLIKIRLPHHSNLQQGRLGWVEVACDAPQPVLLIPEQAIIHYGQLQAVKKIDGKHWNIRHIRTGKRQGEKIEVLSGLQEGDVIWLNSGLTQ